MHKIEGKIVATAAVPADYSELGSLCPPNINNLFGQSSRLSQLPNEANSCHSIQNVRSCLTKTDALILLNHSAPTGMREPKWAWELRLFFSPSFSSTNGIWWPKQNVRCVITRLQKIRTVKHNYHAEMLGEVECKGRARADDIMVTTIREGRRNDEIWRWRRLNC